MESKNRMTEYLKDGTAQAETKKSMSKPEINVLKTETGIGLEIKSNQSDTLDGKDVKIELKALIIQAGRRFKTAAELNAWIQETLLAPLHAESKAHGTFQAIDLECIGRESPYDLEDYEKK